MNAVTSIERVSPIALLDPEQLEFLPAKTLLRLIEKQQAVAKHFASFKKTIGELPELFRALEQIDIDTTFNLENGYVTLSFSGDGPKLTAAWRLLRQHAYNTDQRPKKGDTSFSAFWKSPERAEILMYFTSTLCKRVQVGTQTVEQPVYQTLCGDMPEIDADGGAPVVVVAAGGEFDNDIPF